MPKHTLYTTIDELPISNWYKVLAGKFEYMYEPINPKYTDKAKQTYAAMYMQFEEYPKEVFQTLETKAKIALLKCKVAAGDKKAANDIRVKERILEANKTEGKALTLSTHLQIIQRITGFQVDPNKLSTQLAFKYLRDYEKSLKTKTE